jgi:hypothetical protein
MAVPELAEITLRLAARRAYERGRLSGALWRGACALVLATPGFLICNQSPSAALCLAGFAAVVVVGRVRGLSYEDGSLAGASAGILPCLLPSALRAIDPDLCIMLSSHGPWICGIGGVAAGVVLGLRGRASGGLPFWSMALAALALPATLGCIPAGATGLLGLVIGVVAGGAPVLVARRAAA